MQRNTNIKKGIHSQARAGFAGRKRGGQAIIEGAVAMIMIGFIAIPLLVLLINVGMYMSWKAKYDFVATEAARYIDANRYWLGMTRHDFDEEKAKANAYAIVKKMCATMGLPPIKSPSDMNVEPEQVADVLDSKVTVTKVELDPKLTLTFNGLIPKPLSVMGVGVSTDASQAVPAYCTAVISITRPNQPSNSLAVEVPAYFPMRLNTVDPDGQGFSQFGAQNVAKAGKWNGKRTRVFIGANCVDPIWPANPGGSQVINTNGGRHSFNQLGVQ